jgi:hypothetical protein
MDDDEKNLKWQELLRLEKEARASVCELHKAGASQSMMRKPLQIWWQIVSDVFNIYQAALSQGASPDPPPMELFAVMAELTSYLAAGQIPDSIAHASSRGRHRPGPDEARDIGIAVAYMLAARPGGIITDETPVNTICKVFGINRQTAYKWKAGQPPIDVKLHDGETLVSLMRKAGARYSDAAEVDGHLGFSI